MNAVGSIQLRLEGAFYVYVLVGVPPALMLDDADCPRLNRLRWRSGWIDGWQLGNIYGVSYFSGFGFLGSFPQIVAMLE
jgi:hypothetical protein